VLRPAEGIGDAVFATMAHEQHPLVVEFRTAPHAGAEAVRVVVLLENRARRPVRPLDDPWNDMLQPAEHRTPIGIGLARPEASVGLHGFAAPAAGLGRHAG